ncbi:putative HVA22-like protein g [Elaeis guineensis]|uniref:HVA22-like protein n=1 Tax=Elaeis guineensis var. tenera TaxID=51953 RepID=A0A6J0PEL2_ELAGV|nr:putative HVA22-like protein g [Elaeis guineensis]XP_019703641.1 putative HVA22-like protein g [Elaeis guineensis]
MLGDLATKVLVMLFGYAYPAFECFKTLEQRRWPGEVEQLRFWCQYWVIVAIVTIIERFGEPLVSWLPMYGEAKLAFFVYLWYPKTKGSDLMYETFLRPLVMQYEPDIEQRLRNLRAKSGELLAFYMKNFTDKGTTLFLEVLNYVVSGPSRTQSNRRSGSSGPPNPSAILRSAREAPAPEVGVRGHPNAMGLTAEELEEDAAVAESLRAARVQLRRPRHRQ